jgi:anthranilate synthase component 1
MYYPSLEQVASYEGEANLVPVYREINADLETPVSAYLKVAIGPYSYLLESVEGGERMARYSFIGTDPQKIIKTGVAEELGSVDPLVPVEEMLSEYKLADVDYLDKFNGGAVGYIAYDAVRYFEELPTPEVDPLGLPESIFMLSTTYLVFDHLRHKIKVVSHAHLRGDTKRAYEDAIGRIDDVIRRLKSFPNIPEPNLDMQSDADIEFNMSREYYEDMVEKSREYIIAGDAIQVVVAQRMSRPTSAHPFQIYRSIRTVNPSPYMYYLDMDDFQIVGTSPELLVQVVDGAVAVHPIAGTRRRGRDEAEDLELEEELRTDEKERAEHIMLLDLGRNDIGRVSKPGTVEVSQILDIERYSHVIHLVSHVTGELRDEYTNYDALRACFPAGTVSGAPKIRAMEIIAELEPDRRSVYAGAVGYFDFSGNMDTAIAIRTLVLKDGIAHVQAGGGIVYDSNPEDEYMETIHKASAVFKAIDQAEQEIDTI